MVEFMQADLSAQAEVRRLAEEFQRSHPRLDVLVNNVGAFFMSRRLSADGIELTWALNYLGVYLLTELLLDTLVASAPREASLEHSGRESRVVNVSSAMHTSAQINFDDLQGAAQVQRSEGLRTIQACPGDVHLRPGTPAGRDGSDGQRAAPGVRGQQHVPRAAAA